MPYTLLTGEFVIRYPDLPRSGPQPDGDTVKFAPDTPSLVERTAAPVGRRARHQRARDLGPARGHRRARDALRRRAPGARGRERGARRAAARPRLHRRDVLPRPAEHGRAAGPGPGARPRPLERHRRQRPHDRVRRAGRRDGARRHAGLPRRRPRPRARSTPRCSPPASHTRRSTPPCRRRCGPSSPRRPGEARAAGAGLWPRATADPEGAAQIADLDALEALVLWPKLFRRLVPYLAEGAVRLRRLRRLAARRPGQPRRPDSSWSGAPSRVACTTSSRQRATTCS